MVQMTVQSYRRSQQGFSESSVMSRCKSLSSSCSLTGAPQSITEWLALCEKDPVEILLDLGFGIEEPDVCTKIPLRFLSGASVAKGINIQVFLEAQKQRMDIERPNLYASGERQVTPAVNSHLQPPLKTPLRRRQPVSVTMPQKWHPSLAQQPENFRLDSVTFIHTEECSAAFDPTNSTSLRFRQLKVLDHVTNALSSLLTDVNTQETKAQETVRHETSLADAAKSKRAKRRRIGQLLKRTSQQMMLLKQGSMAPEEANLPNRKEQPCTCADTAERRTVQVDFSVRVMLGRLTQEQTPRGKGALAYSTSQHPPTPSGKAGAPLHLVSKQRHLSSACEVPANDTPRKEAPLLVAHTLRKVADLSYKQPDSFEMEEIQSFEDETLYGDAPDTTSEVMVTRTSSCQSDSSGFMEELQEPVVLQNASLSGKINFISDILNEETTLSHRTVFPTLNQDFQHKPDDCVAKLSITACKGILTAPRSMKACSDQGEKTHLLLPAENDKYRECNAEPQSFVQGMLCDLDKKEDKTERKQPEKERCIKEHSPCFQGDTQDEEDPSSSRCDCPLCFSTGHKQVNVTFTELSDVNPAVIPESKPGGEDEGERCCAGKDVGVACGESAHAGHTGCVERLWWGVEMVSKDGTPLEVYEVTNRQKFCKMDGDPKNTRWSPKMGLTETPQGSSAVRSGRSAPSRCSLQVSQRHPACPVEYPGLRSSEDQETGTIEMMSGTNKSEQGDTVQNCEMVSAPLKSVTVQMSSGLEFTSRAKGTRQNAPLIESIAREAPMDFSDMLAHCSEGGPLVWLYSGASKGGAKQTTEASSQIDIPTKKSRQSPLLWPSHTHLRKSASLDSMLCGKYRSHYWGEACGASCHCCCCHGCCPWTFPVAASPQCPVGCCSNHATAEQQVSKTLMLLQDTTLCNPAPCTSHDIEVMKSSCQHFQEKLDEIEQHLTKEQALFSSIMPDEGREEGRHLQLLRQAVRQQVAELEFQLNNEACLVRESILTQLDQLLAEQSHLFSELGLSDWKGERKAQNKQVPPGAADTAHPQSGHSKMVLQRVPSKNTTATGSVSALRTEAPPVQLPARTPPEVNSAKPIPQDLCTSKQEIKGPPQAKMGFKAFIHNLKKSFQNSLGNDSAEGKH